LELQQRKTDEVWEQAVAGGRLTAGEVAEAEEAAIEEPAASATVAREPASVEEEVKGSG